MPALANRTANRFTTLLLWVVCVVLVLVTVGTMTRSWQAVPVLTGSMEPSISAGDLVVAQNRPVDQAAVGDVIIFHAPGSRAVTVHRIETLQSTPAGPEITTKGDANNVTDRWGSFVLRNDRVWTVRRAIPGLGSVVLWARSDLAQAVALGILVLAVASVLANWRLRRRPASSPAGPSPAFEDSADAEALVAESPSMPTTPMSDTPAASGVEAAEDGHARARVVPRPLATPSAADTSQQRPAVADPSGDEVRIATDAEAWDAVHGRLVGALAAHDPDWSWSPLEREMDGTARYARDGDGKLRSLALDLTLAGRTRAGLGTLPRHRDHRSSWLLTTALASAAAKHGIVVDVEADRADHLFEQVVDLTAPASHHPTTRSTKQAGAGRVGLAKGIGTLALLAAMLGAQALGPGAQATFQDREVDQLGVITTASLGQPTQLEARTEAISTNKCEIILTWEAASGGPDSHVVHRQPLEAGVTTTDGLVTEPTPSGPWSVIAIVEPGTTTTYVDEFKSKEAGAAERFRYRVTARLGPWESAPSNEVEASTLACLDGGVPAPAESVVADPAAEPLTEPIADLLIEPVVDPLP